MIVDYDRTSSMDLTTNPDFRNESFLSILDNKNQIISSLKHRLENQKLQILYYLKKEIDYPKIIDLSRTCTSETSESLPVSLALEHFKKEHNIKSNLSSLYDYMKNVDSKLLNNLNSQEYLLKTLVETLIEIIRNSEKNGLHTTPIITKSSFWIDLFNDLLKATIGLRKNLHSFQISCNNLVVLEDERNSLVEQVLCLTPEERLNFNILMTIKQEQIELDKKSLELRKQQENYKELRILNAIEEDVSGLQKEINMSIDEANKLSYVGNLINNLHKDAKMLLDVTRKYDRADEYKSFIINLIKIAISNGELRTNNKEELSLFQAIKTEFQSIQKQLKEDLTHIKDKYECIKDRLHTVLQEKNELKIINNELECLIKYMEKSHVHEINSLKQESDKLKTQLEDLKVHKGSNNDPLTTLSSNIPRKDTEMKKTIKLLEKKLSVMTETIAKQNQEILRRGETIEDLKRSCKRANKESIGVQHGSKKDSTSTQRLEKSAVTVKSTVGPEEKLNFKTPVASLNKSSGRSSKKKLLVKKSVNKDVKLNKSSTSHSNSTHTKNSDKKYTEKKVESSDNVIELMKDCSRESVPDFCSPVRATIGSERKCSRSVEVLRTNN
ncbi:putative leucine-rich repeat-containing protein DDB_G0290503 [Diabrotica virgifera virgifera]|uniref:Uncharacterized protein n=1 Tax=Diabrotica virgifera virgifera TaxID=50390 RepID=A0ABM5IMT3_DIAVI|nr:putative leucine-rich repeat-containing protein DDB_G0290503 [Diabrotica virgifera virgifera]